MEHPRGSYVCLTGASGCRVMLTILYLRVPLGSCISSSANALSMAGCEGNHLATFHAKDTPIIMTHDLSLHREEDGYRL